MRVIIGTVAFLIVGYLFGSVSYATIVTRLVSGKDIRKIGNLNPGTSNVAREVGKPWGALVAVLDGLKGAVPVLIARLTTLQGDTAIEFFILYCIGIAAVLGHCLPVFHRFKGGGGIGAMQGISLFFIPVEYLVSMLIGGTIVLIGIKKVKYRMGRWTPIMFVTLCPFITLATTLWLDIPLFAHISIGGHSWGMVAGVFVMSLTLLALNLRVMKESGEELEQAKGEERGDQTEPR